MLKRVLNVGWVMGSTLAVLALSMAALATAVESEVEPSAQQATVVGQLFISEVSPAAAPGKPAWIELAVDAQQIFLPLIARNSSAATPSNSASDETLPPAVASSAHGSFVLTFLGQTCALPAALPRVPRGAFVVVVIGIT